MSEKFTQIYREEMQIARAKTQTIARNRRKKKYTKRKLGISLPENWRERREREREGFWRVDSEEGREEKENTEMTFQSKSLGLGWL